MKGLRVKVMKFCRSLLANTSVKQFYFRDFWEFENSFCKSI
jgi:hypothetical protein